MKQDRTIPLVDAICRVSEGLLSAEEAAQQLLALENEFQVRHLPYPTEGLPVPCLILKKRFAYWKDPTSIPHRFRPRLGDHDVWQ